MKKENFIMRICAKKKQTWQTKAEKLGLPLSKLVELSVDHSSFTINGVKFNDKRKVK